MKPLFQLPTLVLALVSLWIGLCCAALLEWDSSGNLIAHSYSVWGDWSAHFTFISNLLERGPAFLWGDNPVFSGIPFQYPFLSHVFTAILSFALKFNPIQATYWSSLSLMFALPFCLHYWFRSLQLKPWTSVIAVLIFLLIGGFQIFDSSLNPGEPLTNQFSKGSIFTQFVGFEFFPQRAFLFGLVAFTLLGGKLLRWIDQNQLSLKRSILIGLGISFTAWLHLHTWIAFAALLACCFAFASPADRKKTFIFGLSIAAFSGVLLSFLLLRDHAHETRISWDRWLPGWAQNPKTGMNGAAEMNFVSFWLYNTGLFLPLALIGAYLKRKDLLLRPSLAAGTLIFIVALLFNIQPYFYDNLKLFTYSFLLLAPFVASAIEPLFSKKILFPAGLGLIALQCWTAVHDLEFLRKGGQSANFFHRHEFELAQEFQKLRESPNDLVLINPRHNHWVSCLTGNPVAMGFPGWLWSWGINYGERERQVQSILLGKPDLLDQVKKLGIHYIIVHQNDQIANQPIQLETLRSNFQSILSKNGWEIFSTRSPASSVR